MSKLYKFLMPLVAIVAMALPAKAQTPGDLVSTFPYSCDFESTSVSGTWVTVNGTQISKWFIGTAVNATAGGSTSLNVSADNGVSNTYASDPTGSGTGAASYTWAYQRFTMAAGTYNISFQWRNFGEFSGDPFDFFRVFIVPDAVTLTAGTLPDASYTWSNQFMSDVPTGWIGINNGALTYFVNDSTFSTLNTEFTVTTAGNYKLVFLWLNDDNADYPPAAAIDDISISMSTCPAPYDLTFVSQDASGITVSWTPLGTETSWAVYVDGALEGIATTSTYTIANAAQGNNVIAVAAVCGAGDTSSLCPPISVFVAADPVTDFPYTTGFEDGDDDGWEFVNDATNQWFIGTAAHNTGTKGLYISNNNGTSNAYTNSSIQFSYAYRTLSFSESGQYAVSFDWKANGEGNYDYLRAWIAPASAIPSLVAGHSPDGGTSANAYQTTTPSGWIDLGGKMNLQTSWQTCIATPSLSAGTYILVFMWANDGSGGTTPPAAVDNVIITQLSCPAPTNLAVTDLVPDGFTFSWSAGGSEAAWQVSINDSVFEVYDTTVTFTNRPANTTFTLKVRGICDVDDTSFWSTVQTATPCDFIDALPYVQDFESATTGSSTTGNPFGANCWVRLNNGTSYGGYPYISSSSSYNHTTGGSKGLYWYNTTTAGTYGDYQCIVLPGVDPDDFPANTLQLSFWAKPSSSSYHPVFQVGVMTNPMDINSFEVVQNVNVEGTNWTKYEVMLAGYTGTGNFVAIRAMRASWTAYVDDIVLDEIPACAHPIDLVVDSATTEDIYVHWTAVGTETSWALTINDSVVTDATDTSYTFTNLTLNTLYTITVAALCDGGDTSDAISVNARTLAGDPVSDFPFMCTFEDPTVSANFVIDAKQGNNDWYIGSAVSNGGDNSLYVSNTNGTTNAYDGSAASLTYAYVSFQMQPGEYAFSFDWKCYGESSYDFLRVALAPNSTTLPGDYSSWGTGATAPSGFTALDGGKMNQINSWETKVGTFSITTAGVYNFIFVWRNDNSVTNSGPAAIDNFQLVQNTCPAPTNFTATYTGTDTIIVTWNSGGEETSWQVTNGIDTVDVNDSTYTFDGLSANTVYNLMVRGICDVEDTSMWTSISVRTACGLLTALPFTEDFENVATGSSSTGSTFVPCWHRLNNGTSYGGYPYVSASTTYNHTENGGQGLYWYNTTTTGTYGDYQIIVLPGVDTMDIPVNTLKLTFWAKPSSTSYAPVFYAGVMTDPAVDSTFQYYDTIYVEHTNTSWVKYTVMFNNYDGYGNYVAIRANRPGSTWTAYVDDITLDQIPACPAVEDIEVEAGPVSALATWRVIGDSYLGATVEYKADTATTWASVVVSGVNYAVITGLEPMTTYDLRVTATCADADGLPATAQFNTSNFACAVLDPTNSHFDTVTGVATTSYQRPCNNFYRNTFSEQIYDSTELAGAGPIMAFSLHYAYATPMTSKNNCMVYMGNTSLSTISTANYVTPANMTLVYTGPLNCVNGWNEFQLDIPFNYTGGNLAVAVIDNSDLYDGSAYVWAGHNASGKSFSWYSDSYTYPNSSMSTNTDAFRPDMAFSFIDCIQQSTCAAPVAMITGTTTSTLSAVWAPGASETSWNVSYRLAGASAWSTPVTVTTNSYTFTGLDAGMPYELKIEAVCGSENPAAVIEGVTNCAAISSLPFEEDFNNWGSGTGVIPNCWYRTGTYSTYTYISPSFNMTGTTGGSIYMYCSSGGSYDSWLIMPELDTTVYQVNQTQLAFNALYNLTSYGEPTFVVGVMSDPMNNSTFVPVDTVTVTSGINQWEVFEVSFANYTGNGNHVALHTLYPGTYFYAYLDNFTLEAIPTCPRPDSLAASNATTTTVDLSWHERGSASNWIIEYGPRGFELGTGTVVAANSNPFTLTGLPVAYQGEYYVRSICSSTDTGEYSRRPCAFGTSQIPATLPYDYDFENVAEWNSWQTSSNSTIDWYRGTAVADGGSYSMYVSADAGTTYTPYQYTSVVNAAAYRDIDFGPIDSSYTISFRARVGGTVSNRYDAMMVFLVDPSMATVPSNNGITSPWGNVNDLYRIATVYLDTTWQTYEASFDTIHGIHRVAFFWFNQNTAASYDFLPEPAAVDNIHIAYSTCPRPVALNAVNIGATSATLTWTADPSATYEVVYREVNGANQVAITNTNSYTLTGLDTNTEYRAWVRKYCSVGDTSLYSDGVAFSTTVCDGAQVAYSYDPATSSTTSTYGPIGYSFYNYGYVQTIIDSAKMAAFASGNVSAFGFNPTVTTSGDQYEGMTVYMANVPENDLSAGFIHPDANHVFVPVITNRSFSYTTTGWQIHEFDSTFTWDGHSNVLISVKRDNGDYVSGATFSAHTLSGNKMRYVYQDGSPYDPATVTDGTATNVVGDIMLITCGAGCPAPAITSIANDYASATITVVGNNIGYELTYGTDPSNLGNPMTNATGTFTLTGLTPATQYFIAVTQLCDSGDVSPAALRNFTTDSLPCFDPTGLAVVNTTFSSAELSWTSTGNATSWVVSIAGAGATRYDTVSTNPYTITGLYADQQYTVMVMALCGGGAAQSGWSEPLSFTTDICTPVSNVTVDNVTATSAQVNWSAVQGSMGYKLYYGYPDFYEEEAETAEVPATATSYTITGLTAETQYEVYVRNRCTEILYSNVTANDRVGFTTGSNGIYDVESGTLTLYPNPASEKVTLTVTGFEGQVEVEIVDMNGRVSGKWRVDNGELTVDVSELAQGAYFVRVTGDSQTAVRKLIVK